MRTKWRGVKLGLLGSEDTDAAMQLRVNCVNVILFTGLCWRGCPYVHPCACMFLCPFFFPSSEIQFTLSHIHETPEEVICQSGETVRVSAAWLAMCVSVRPLFVCSDSSSCSGHPQSQCY